MKKIFLKKQKQATFMKFNEKNFYEGQFDKTSTWKGHWSSNYDGAKSDTIISSPYCLLLMKLAELRK
jgi:hypothetical protein